MKAEAVLDKLNYIMIGNETYLTQMLNDKKISEELRSHLEGRLRVVKEVLDMTGRI